VLLYVAFLVRFIFQGQKVFLFPLCCPSLTHKYRKRRRLTLNVRHVCTHTHTYIYIYINAQPRETCPIFRLKTYSTDKTGVSSAPVVFFFSSVAVKSSDVRAERVNYAIYNTRTWRLRMDFLSGAKLSRRYVDTIKLPEPGPFRPIIRATIIRRYSRHRSRTYD